LSEEEGVAGRGGERTRRKNWDSYRPARTINKLATWPRRSGDK